MPFTHKVFGVERNIDISPDVFPTQAELDKLEGYVPGCEHGWFDSVCEGGAKLHYRKWLPQGTTNPKAIVVFMHGILGHCGQALVDQKTGRKVNMALKAEAFTEKQGFALYSMDMYGHGFSEGTRGFIPGTWENNKDDLIAFCNLVASQHDESIPLFLMGESYGSTLAIHVALEFQEKPSKGPKNFDSIILTSPAIIADLPPYPVYFVLRYMLAPLAPRWSPFFMPHPVSPDRIWRDPDIRAMKMEKRYKEMGIDGSGKTFRLGTAVNMLLSLEEARTKAIPGLKLPYCIVHGTDDFALPIEGAGYMWEHTQTPDADRCFHRISGAYHDVFSDPLAEDCVQHVVDWIETRLKVKK